MSYHTTALSSWGNTCPETHAKLYEAERLDVLQDFVINNPALSMLPIGNLRSYGDVCLSHQAVHLSMRWLNHVLDFDKENLIVTVRAGMLMRELTDFAIRQKALPCVVPGTGFATVGGAFANDIHGKNHEKQGCFSKAVIGLELMDKQGITTYITPQSHPDLFWATAGGLGLTGIIISLTVKLMPMASPTLKVTRKQCKNLADMMDKFQHVEADYSVAWIDTLATGDALGRGVLETAVPAGVEIMYDTPETSSVPFFLPSFCLNKYSVKLFNHFYYHRSAANRQGFEDYRTFSYPLDAIYHWNRIYGRRGFYQFQCVIPENDNSYVIFEEILEKCAAAGFSSFLAVLKKMGDQGEGWLSFPMKGYTLAMDFSHKTGVIPLLKEFEHLVLKNGGRIYCAKDALLSKEHFWQMYPKAQAFKELIAGNGFTSNAGVRLGLC